MRFMSRFFLVLLPIVGVCLSVGCDEKTTEPEKPPAPRGVHVWSKSFGDAFVQNALGVAVDAAGNTFIVGSFDGTVDFGGDQLTSAGSRDVFVAKFGPDGTHIWSKRFGDDQWQVALDVAVDGSGNVIVVGYFEGTVNFGGDALMSAGYEDIFVAKFTSGGTHDWSKRFGDAGVVQRAEGVTVDGADNIVVTGDFRGTADFGGDQLTSAGVEDIFVAEFQPDGTHIWSERFGDATYQYGYGVAVDDSANVIVAGSFQGTVNFGGDDLTSLGDEDVYVAKFRSNGAHLWSKRFGGSSYQVAQSIAVDGAGKVIITGDFDGTVDFGGGTLTSAGGCDLFVAAFGLDGAHRWSRRFGDAVFGEYATGVDVDPSGNIVMTGCFEGTIDFGGGVMTCAGDRDIFVAKFTSGGAHDWSKRFGDASQQSAWDVAVDGSGDVILTGGIDGTVYFGGDSLVSAGGNDVFVVKLTK